ncbi:MAG: ATP-binding protein [Lachnospiraceae bacterium]|nr:ATP-binding protein [Lachnospiraceae bacterium]
MMFRKSRIKIVALLMAILMLMLLGTIAVIYGVSYRQVNLENRDMLELYAEKYLENGGLPGTDNVNDEMEDLPDAEGTSSESTYLPDMDDESADLLNSDRKSDSLLDMSGTEDEYSESDVQDENRTQEDQTQEETGELSARNAVMDDFAGEGDTAKEGDYGEEGAPAEDDDFRGISRRLQLSTFYSVVFSSDGSVLTVNNDDPSQLSDEALTELARSFLDTGKSYGISHNMVYLISGEDYTLVSMVDNTVVGESIVTLLRYTVIFGAAAVVAVLILSVFLAGWIIKPLEENYRRQNQFISDAGHELKTPVSTISTNVELLGREIGDNRWLENIRYENGRMTEIVRSLLDLLRAESSTAQLKEMERIDLGRTVTAGVLPFEARAFEEGLQLTCDIAENLFIQGDAAQLGKLISILIDNAFAHTNPSGEIRVSLTSEKSSAILTVANEGEPIPPESVDKIFDRFYRVDSSRALSDENGTAQPHYGLGLSIAKAIAAAHRAKISVECADGITSFIVIFPLRAKQ